MVEYQNNETEPMTADGVVRIQKAASVPVSEAFMMLDGELNTALEKGVDAINPETFSRAWEAAKSHRPLVMAFLARKLRRRIREQPEMETELFANGIDFVFKFMGKRYIGMAFDLFLLASDSDREQAVQLISLASKSPYATRGRMESAIYGASGFHYFNPEKYSSFDDLDIDHE